MEFKGNKQFARSPSQESAPKSPNSPLSPWAEQVRGLIDQIDHNPQLEETKPGVDFAKDMARLLDPETLESRAELVGILDALYNDLMYHDFTIGLDVDEEGENHIHMANETSIPELGNLFKEFSQQLSQFPVPGFDKELADKRNRLVEAFANRGKNLAG